MDYKTAIELMKQGDERGFEFLYTQTYSQKKWDLTKILGNEEDAEDILQNAYIKMIERIDQLDNPDKFPAWFGRLAINMAIDLYRARHPRSAGNQSGEDSYQKTVSFDDLETVGDDGSESEFEIEDERIDWQPEVVYTRRETRDLVHTMMETLPDEQRICLIMFHIQGFSIREIADFLGVPDNTVKSRLNYARKNIKEQGEKLREQGIPLYGIAPLPLLLALLRSEAGSSCNVYPASLDAVSDLWTKVIVDKAEIGFNTQAGGMTSPDFNGSRVERAASRTGKNGFLGTGAGKVVAGVIIATALAGTTAGVVAIMNSDNTKDESRSVVGRILAESTDTEMSMEMPDAKNTTEMSDAEITTKMINTEAASEIETASSETSEPVEEAYTGDLVTIVEEERIQNPDRNIDQVFETPYIHLAGEEIDAVNTEIKTLYDTVKELCKEDMNTAWGAEKYGDMFIGTYTYLDSTWNEADDVLSVVLRFGSNEYRKKEDIIYNIDIKNSHVMSKDEVLDKWGMSKEEFDQKVVSQLKYDDETTFADWDGGYIDEKTYEQNHIDTAVPYIGENGEKMFYIICYTRWGFGEGVWTLSLD